MLLHYVILSQKTVILNIFYLMLYHITAQRQKHDYVPTDSIHTTIQEKMDY
jgi:hypothetical protein